MDLGNARETEDWYLYGNRKAPITVRNSFCKALHYAKGPSTCKERPCITISLLTSARGGSG